MSTIISARFQTQDEIGAAIDGLEKHGFARSGISSFYVNPAGQHDLYPIGGDQDASPGAEHTGRGLVEGISAGGAVGAAIGAATIPLTGAVGPIVGGLVGGHLGSLVGSLNATKENGGANQGGENAHPQRKAGMMVAVAVTTPQEEEAAVTLLCAMQGDAIERSQGVIADGDWTDFDPLSEPHWVTNVGQSM